MSKISFEYSGLSGVRPLAQNRKGEIRMRIRRWELDT